MSWQTPGGDPPPDPAAPTSPVPVTPSAEPPVPEPAPESTPTTPPQGLISAAPVGWAATDQPAASGAAPSGPEVAWAPPAATAAVSMGEGWVIAGVFSRLVAYFIDYALLAIASLVIFWTLGRFRGGSLTDAFVPTTGWLVASVVFLLVDAIYFVAFWRSPWQATIGMRLIKVRVLRSVDGGTLSMNSAVTRWFGLSGLPQLLGYIPFLGSFISLIWEIILLITSASHPLRQGLHDRWAGSVVVQPAPGGSGAAIIGCLLLIAIPIILLIVLLFMLGPQIRDILSQVGDSI